MTTNANPTSPLCTCCNLHGAGRGQDLKEWFIGALPFPIPASMVSDYLELVRHWEQNIRKVYEGSVRDEGGI